MPELVSKSLRRSYAARKNVSSESSEPEPKARLAARKLNSVDDPPSRLSSASTLAVKSLRRDRFEPHPQRSFAARKNVSVVPPPVGAARKYIQNDRRPLSGVELAKKSAPSATLWAPSMRPSGPNSDPRPHQRHVPPPLGENHAQKQGSYHRRTPLPPSTQRRFPGAMLRKSAPLMGPPHHDNRPSHPQPPHSLRSYMTPSDIKARKSMQAIEPAWLTADASYAATLGRKRTRDDSGWMFPSMSASRMVPARGPNTNGSRMVDEVKAQIRPGLRYKLEGEGDSDDDIEIVERGNGAAATYQSKAARKYNQIAMKAFRFTDTLRTGSVGQKSSTVRPADLQESTSSDEKSMSTPDIDELEDSDIDYDKAPRKYTRLKNLKSLRFVGTLGTTSSDEKPESDIDELESDIDSDTTDKITTSPPEELMAALEALTLTSMQMQRARQLPFLLRNLRKGFEHRCQLVGISSSEERRLISASVVYKLRVDGSGVEFGGLGSSTAKEYTHKAHMTAWRCPLCELHGEFKTREMLRTHLTWDHDGVNTIWEQLKGGKWQMTLIIPEFTEEDELPSLKFDSDPEGTMSRPEVLDPGLSTYEHPDPAVPSPAQPSTQTTVYSTPVVSTPVQAPQELQVSSPGVPPPVFPTTLFSPTRPTEHPHTHTERLLTPAILNVPSAAPIEELVVSTIQSPIPVRLFTPPLPRIEVQVPIPSPSTPPIPFKLKYRSPSPTPNRLSSQPASSRARSTTATTTTSISTTITAYQRRQSKSASVSAGRPSRYPTPPPPEDPLGPAAQYPYLPFTFDNEEGKVHFSARPDGPRLYDLLNGLSMKRFGVLSWSVVDKEEEMFQCDDVRDEDKVMQALWGRWIMLNRSKFVANFYAGTMAFVDDYWRIIHRAAGWAALRTWLLMLVLNRFVTGSEIVKILKRYEQLTGMDYWYNEQEPEP